MNEFLTLCAHTGVADFMYYKTRYAPKWMNARERKAWKIGYDYASSLVN